MTEYGRGRLVWVPTDPSLEKISRNAVYHLEGAFVPLHLSGTSFEKFESDGTLSLSAEIVGEGLLLGMTDNPPLISLRAYLPYYRECFERLATLENEGDVKVYAETLCDGIGRVRGAEKRQRAIKGADILFPEIGMMDAFQH